MGKDFRFRPRYTPLNYGIDAGDINIADGFNVLKSGIVGLLGGKDQDGDGFKDGALRQLGKKMKNYRQNVVPKMYDYTIEYDPNTTAGTYSYNAQQLFDASRTGNRLFGKKQLMPAETYLLMPGTGLEYTNPDPNDPTKTEFVNKTEATFYNRDREDIPGYDGLVVNPQFNLQNLSNAMSTLGGLPPVKLPSQRKFNRVVNDIGDFFGKQAEKAPQFIDRLGNNINRIFGDLIEKGEITVDDIKNKSENFYNKLRTFYQEDIANRFKAQVGKNVREYEQNRLLEIGEMLNNPNIPREELEKLFVELQNIRRAEQGYIANMKTAIGELDEKLDDNSLPVQRNSKGVPIADQGSGFVSPNTFNYLKGMGDAGMACNTYACSILRQYGATYPINMESIKINNIQYDGGDKVAVIPGNRQQDSIYNYETGEQGFTFKNITDEKDYQAGDYGRIGYPYTGHAVLYTGDRGEAIYNSGDVDSGLKTSDAFSGDINPETGKYDPFTVVEYTGNLNFIDSLMDDITKRGQDKKYGGEELAKAQFGIPGLMQGMLAMQNELRENEFTDSEGNPVPEADFSQVPETGFNFTGTPIPVFEDRTTVTMNPNFNFSSLLSGQTNFMEDTQAVSDARLQQEFPDLGPTPAQQAGQPVIVNTEQVQVGETIPEPPEVVSPKVTRNFGSGLKGVANRVGTALNRIENSPLFKVFEEGSKFAVGAADFANDIFLAKKVKEANEEMRELNMADNMFGVAERTDRGDYDTNTGLLRPDMTVTSSYGQEGGELEVDDKTLKQLIAAGADIEIIE